MSLRLSQAVGKVVRSMAACTAAVKRAGPLNVTAVAFPAASTVTSAVTEPLILERRASGGYSGCSILEAHAADQVSSMREAARSLVCAPAARLKPIEMKMRQGRCRCIQRHGRIELSKVIRAGYLSLALARVHGISHSLKARTLGTIGARPGPPCTCTGRCGRRGGRS